MLEVCYQRILSPQQNWNESLRKSFPPQHCHVCESVSITELPQQYDLLSSYWVLSPQHLDQDEFFGTGTLAILIVFIPQQYSLLVSSAYVPQHFAKRDGFTSSLTRDSQQRDLVGRKLVFRIKWRSPTACLPRCAGSKPECSGRTRQYRSTSNYWG